MKRTQFMEGWFFENRDGRRKQINLPHDAMQEAGREPKAASGRSGAFYKSGYYTYTKQVDIPAEWKDKRLYLRRRGK